MNLDFSFAKYQELCETISKSDYVPLTVERYLSLKVKPELFIIIRHDVDSQPDYALKMAKRENELGIASSYYFRHIEGIFLPELINEIADLGHEIGYHYEVLDKARGNHAQAIKIFGKELNEFRRFYDVKTIAQHGSPLIGSLAAISISGMYAIVKSLIRHEAVFTDWTSRDLWAKYNFKDFGIIGEAYLSIDFNEILYLSDTGRSWDSTKYKIKDFVDDSNSLHSQIKVKHTDDIIKLIKEENINMCLLVHANQWKEKIAEWLKWLMLQQIRNVGKLGLKWYWKIIKHKQCNLEMGIAD